MKKRNLPKRGRPTNRRKMREQALLAARAVPPVSEGLEYKVSADTDGDRLEVYTRQAYAAVLVSQILADKLKTRTHLSLGRRVLLEESPKRRRLV